MNQVWALRVYDKEASQPGATSGSFHDVYLDERDIPAVSAHAEAKGLRADPHKHVVGWISAEDAFEYIDKAIA